MRALNEPLWFKVGNNKLGKVSPDEPCCTINRTCDNIAICAATKSNKQREKSRFNSSEGLCSHTVSGEMEERNAKVANHRETQQAGFGLLAENC